MSKDRTSSVAGDAAVVASLIEKLRCWAELRADIRGLVLVGSHARGTARADSDIDLVLVFSDPLPYTRDTDWLSTFGEVVRFSLEDWGKVQSIRVFYRNGSEVEFGITSLDWIAVPVDDGTAGVHRSGHSVLLDREGLVEAAVRNLRGSV